LVEQGEETEWGNCLMCKAALHTECGVTEGEFHYCGKCSKPPASAGGGS
jgi:hypothetical protein